MIGISQSQLDAIELRLVGVDHRPWKLSERFDAHGRKYICKGSRKAWKRALNRSSVFTGEPDPGELEGKEGEVDANHTASGVSPRALMEELALFSFGQDATEDMGSFVCHAPDDIERLLKEVAFLRKRYRDCEKERDEFRKEMLSARVEKSSLQEKYSDLRKVIRDFGAAIKGCQS